MTGLDTLPSLLKDVLNYVDDVSSLRDSRRLLTFPLISTNELVGKSNPMLKLSCAFLFIHLTPVASLVEVVSEFGNCEK